MTYQVSFARAEFADKNDYRMRVVAHAPESPHPVGETAGRQKRGARHL